ncbi:MAG TPA: sugar-binding protein, partial [Chitinophagaceae bacterium]|nr:sugar-binding protein [Chitinophagaceae bacterium]
MLLRRYICFTLLMLYGSLHAQEKKIEAIKTSQAPRIDGILDDAAWAAIPPLVDFVQNFPSWGSPATQRTEVKLIYDNSAIYVGALLHDDPALIRKQLTARDEEQRSDVDYFSVFFDTYHDHQNGFQFLVTSANVQTDARLSPNLETDDGDYGDKTWDAVWESKTTITSQGWVVEMKIPYISLRFARKPVQDWGLQLLRFVRRNNESSFWSPVDPNVNGFVNQFGTLTQLRDILPPLRLSFSPYVSTGVRHIPQKNGYITEWLRNGGMDVKYGIN